MTINKSDIIKQLKKSYPNFLSRDLDRLVSIILDEMKQALKRKDRVELRNFGVFFCKTQRARISRNPATGEKVNTPEKSTINFRMSKEMFKKLNDKK